MIEESLHMLIAQLGEGFPDCRAMEDVANFLER
jgi:hypothetical protein